MVLQKDSQPWRSPQGSKGRFAQLGESAEEPLASAQDGVGRYWD